MGKYLLYLFIILALPKVGHTQRFCGFVDGSLVMSQVAQDKLAGFKKPGYDFGVGVRYELVNLDQLGCRLSISSIGSNRYGEVPKSAAQNVYELNILSAGPSFFIENM